MAYSNYEVKKYIKKSKPNTAKRRWTMKIGRLEVFFDTIKEAERYYQEYLK